MAKAKVNTSLVFHQIHNNADLKDKKHLNEKGVKKFAKGLKAAYFNTTPKKKPTIKRNEADTFPIGNHSPYNLL
jgi:hypothetical protein